MGKKELKQPCVWVLIILLLLVLKLLLFPNNSPNAFLGRIYEREPYNREIQWKKVLEKNLGI